ncbi:MAG TPA: hypothetical protein VMT52_14110, partial [Planctomycetota bacterium]|nr:hypothetical protein [Planctomycetota bacterium]
PLLVGRALRVVERKALPLLDMGPLMIAACGLAAAVFVLWILFQRQANARRLERLAGAARPVFAPGPGRAQFPATHSRPHVERKPPLRFKFRRPLPGATGRGDLIRISGRQRTLIRVAVLGAALVCMALLAFNMYVKKTARERPASLDRRAQFSAAFGEADQAWKEIHGAQEKAWLEEKPLGQEDLALIRRKLKILEKSAGAVDDLLFFSVRREDGDDLQARHWKLRLWILDVNEILESAKKRPDGEARAPEEAGFYIPFERALRRGREARGALEALAGERAAPPASPGAGHPAGGPVSPGTPPRGLPEIREALARARAELLRLEEFVRTGLNQDGLTALDLPELGLLREESSLLAEDIQRAEALEARPPTEK